MTQQPSQSCILGIPDPCAAPSFNPWQVSLRHPANVSWRPSFCSAQLLRSSMGQCVICLASGLQVLSRALLTVSFFLRYAAKLRQRSIQKSRVCYSPHHNLFPSKDVASESSLKSVVLTMPSGWRPPRHQLLSAIRNVTGISLHSASIRVRSPPLGVRSEIITQLPAKKALRTPLALIEGVEASN